MYKQRKSRKTFCVALCLVVMSLGVRIEAQGQEANDSFADIPVDQRPKLFQQIELSIKYQATQNWNKMYDISAERLEKMQTKGEYLKTQNYFKKAHSKSVPIKFSPRSAALTNEYGNVKEWSIYGCGIYRRKGKMIRLSSNLTAALSNGQWYFSPVGPVIYGTDGPEVPCTFEAKKREGKAK